MTAPLGMGVFSQLRQMCIHIEKEIPKLQEAVNCPKRDSLGAGEAARLLQDANKDVRQLKSEMKKLQTNMMQDIDIIALVQAVKSLIEVQKERVSKVEKHMQKYGYTPLPPKQAEAEICKETAGGETIIEESASPTTPTQQSQPPRHMSSGERTPTMEGFDPDILQKVAKVQEAVSVSRKVMDFKRPDKQPNLPLLPPTPAELRRDSADVPDIFEHQGMYMTPGIFNGMPLPSETPAKLEGGGLKCSRYVSTHKGRFQTPMEPSRPVSGSRIGPITMMGLDADDTASSNGDLSHPSLDITATNSVCKPSANTAEPTSGILKSPAPPLKRRNSLDSPVAPEMTEDLRKLLSRYAPVTSLAAPKSSTTGVVSSEDNSPVPPDFLTKQASVPQPNSLDNSPVPPDFLLKQTPVLPGQSSSEPSPVPPDFLTKTGDIAVPNAVPRVLHQIQHPEEHDVGPAPVLRRVSIEDQDLPEMPTLDVTALPGLNPNLLAKLTGPVQPQGPQNPLVAKQVPLVAKLSGPKQQVEMGSFKENMPPTPRSRPLDEMTTIVDMVSQKEYQRQPSYLTNQLTLDTVNRIIEKTNRILLNKIAEGIELELHESELCSDLGKSTQAFLLLMNRLGRLKLARVNGQIVYRIP